MKYHEPQNGLRVAGRPLLALQALGHPREPAHARGGWRGRVGRAGPAARGQPQGFRVFLLNAQEGAVLAASFVGDKREGERKGAGEKERAKGFLCEKMCA